MLSDVIPLADIVEKGFERLVADRSLGEGSGRPLTRTQTRRRSRNGSPSRSSASPACPTHTMDAFLAMQKLVNTHHQMVVKDRSDAGAQPSQVGLSSSPGHL